MTKSSAILFILMFSLIFRLEEPRAGLVLVVVLVAAGLFLFTYKSTQFDADGFALVLAASFVGGARWTLTQMLLQKAELGLQNPIDTMFHLQPLMFLGLFPLFAAVEGLPLSTSRKLFRAEGAGALAGVLCALLGGGLLAFGLGFSEFLLVSRTSSLTLSIAGIFKEVCTLLMAAHWLGDQINLLNWLGFAICLSGISLHVTLKALSAKGEPDPRTPKGAHADPDLELLKEEGREGGKRRKGGREGRRERERRKGGREGGRKREGERGKGGKEGRGGKEGEREGGRERGEREGGREGGRGREKGGREGRREEEERRER
uniref:Sugar phosphate transporter domain-containing protein n=1 Tax=Ornithorhynchus anatinus TaxID=9258 RepID=A0A6I8N9X8_ORNAN